jgi:GNAT superfamily N-acetyltransferase
MIIYRDHQPDPEAYLNLFETTGWNEGNRVDAAALARALSGSWYMLAAYDGDELVGFGRVVSDGVMYASIHDLIVRPSHQHQGIATVILQDLVERCHSEGIRGIQLFAARGTEEFYRKRGFATRPADSPGMEFPR